MSTLGWDEDTVMKIVQNPVYVAEIDPRLCRQGRPRRSRAEWIAANVVLMEEQGTET
jgi:hypothetical protein